MLSWTSWYKQSNGSQQLSISMFLSCRGQTNTILGWIPVSLCDIIKGWLDKGGHFLLLGIWVTGQRRITVNWQSWCLLYVVLHCVFYAWEWIRCQPGRWITQGQLKSFRVALRMLTGLLALSWTTRKAACPCHSIYNAPSLGCGASGASCGAAAAAAAICPLGKLESKQKDHITGFLSKQPLHFRS